MTPIAYRRDIDGLRAVAVIPVMLYHANLGVTGGFVGVDVFFVISGFLITTVIQREIAAGEFSVLKFYERRIRRLFPALFVVVAVSVIAAYQLLMPPEFEMFGMSAIAAALFSSNILFWMEAGYFDSAAAVKPLLHTWSLGVEEQFYIVFPLLLLALRPAATRLRGLAVGVLALVSLAASAWLIGAHPTLAFYFAPLRFWELGCGAVLALCAGDRALPRALAPALTVVGVALIAASAVFYRADMSFPGLAAVPPVAGAMLVILGGAADNPASRVLGAPPLAWTGRISYSLYLWHWPLLVFPQYALGHTLTGPQAALAFALTFPVAWLSWRFVEQPFRKPQAFGRRIIFAGGLGAMAAATVAGSVIVSFDGMPGRLPSSVQAIYAARDDKSRFSKPGCLADMAAGPDSNDIRAGRVCAMGAEHGTPDFLVWGDSHAGAMAPAIDEVARRFGASGAFIGRASCLPLIDYESASPLAVKRQQCREANAATLGFIADHGIRRVFLIGRWPREVLGGDYGNEGIFFDPSAPVKTVDRSAIVARAVDETLQALARLHVQPVIVMDVPEVGYSVPYSLARAALAGVPARIEPKWSTVESRHHLAREILTNAAATFDAGMVDPLPLFCDAANCAVADHGIPLYADEDHLSRAGALRLAPLFEPYFSHSLAER